MRHLGYPNDTVLVLQIQARLVQRLTPFSPAEAHHKMMEQPGRFLAQIPGIQLTQQMETCLNQLRIEAIGPGQRGDNGRQYLSVSPVPCGHSDGLK